MQHYRPTTDIRADFSADTVERGLFGSAICLGWALEICLGLDTESLERLARNVPFKVWIDFKSGFVIGDGLHSITFLLVNFCATTIINILSTAPH